MTTLIYLVVLFAGVAFAVALVCAAAVLRRRAPAGDGVWRAGCTALGLFGALVGVAVVLIAAASLSAPYYAVGY